MNIEQSGPVQASSGISVGRVVAIAFGVSVATAVIAIVAAVLYFRSYVSPEPFEPVALDAVEQRALEQKLGRIEALGGTDTSSPPPERLEPERYTESDAARTIELSERELNALIANDPEFASRVAIDLDDELASVTMLIPVDPDIPVLGGKTLRVNAGLEIDYRNDRPVAILKGVSLMGVPIPNAWLGNLKNVDLIEEFGSEAGSLKSFADGVEYIGVRRGRLTIILRE